MLLSPMACIFNLVRTRYGEIAVFFIGTFLVMDPEFSWIDALGVESVCWMKDLIALDFRASSSMPRGMLEHSWSKICRCLDD